MRIQHCMKLLVLIVAVGLSIESRAANTPMGAKLAADGITQIECSVRDPKENRGVFVGTSNNSENPLTSTKLDGYHYKLYLPKSYAEHPDYKYPCLFIASAGGGAGMGQFANRLKRDEWIVVMLQESKNNSPDWLRNFFAAHDDAVERVRIAKGAKFATGYSGGARCASVFATVRSGFAGVICQAAGFAYGFKPEYNPYDKFPAQILVAGTYGDKDMNLGEGVGLRGRLKQCLTHVQLFQGGHGWCTPEVFDNTLDWMEENLFVAAKAQKGRSASAPTPDKPVEFTSGGKTIKPEALSEDAYWWYYRKCIRLLPAATEKTGRALLVERLLAAISRGQLAKDPAIAAAAKAWQTELNELHASREYVEFTRTAQKDFLDAERAEEALAYAAKPTRTAFEETMKAYQTLLEKYPDSPLSAEAKINLGSLEVVVSKIHPPEK